MDDKAAMDDAAAMAPMDDSDRVVIPGNYDLAYADGTAGTLTIREDGTYALMSLQADTKRPATRLPRLFGPTANACCSTTWLRRPA